MDTTIEVLLKAAEFIEQNEKSSKNTINYRDRVHSNCSSQSSSLSSSLSSCSYLSTSFQSVYLNPKNQQPSKIILRQMNNPNTKLNNHITGDHAKAINNDILSNDPSKTNIITLKNIKIVNSPDSFRAKSNKYEEFHELQLHQQKNKYQLNFGSVSPIDMTNEINLETSINDKSPVHIYSTSPSSFSCSSSNSSLFSMSNMGILGCSDEKMTNIDDECEMNDEDEIDVDSYGEGDKTGKSEDLKRNKMIHNILEKNRRAHLKDCFENLQCELPHYREKKVTNLLILKQAIKYLEQVKRFEAEYETELRRLLEDNATLLKKLERLKSDKQ